MPTVAITVRCSTRSTPLPADPGKPTAIIAPTTKAAPISFLSDDVAWRHKVPSEVQAAAALAELEAR